MIQENSLKIPFVIWQHVHWLHLIIEASGKAWKGSHMGVNCTPVCRVKVGILLKANTDSCHLSLSCSQRWKYGRTYRKCGNSIREEEWFGKVKNRLHDCGPMNTYVHLSVLCQLMYFISLLHYLPITCLTRAL